MSMTIIKEAYRRGMTEDVSVFYSRVQKAADLNLKPATTHPLATQGYSMTIEMIKTLIQKGGRVCGGGGVLPDANRGDGKLSDKILMDPEAGTPKHQGYGDLKGRPA
ncbi:MAG: hypothetical protein V8S31_04000 [Lachnospiraceae bacterium]